MTNLPVWGAGGSPHIPADVRTAVVETWRVACAAWGKAAELATTRPGASATDYKARDLERQAWNAVYPARLLMDRHRSDDVSLRALEDAIMGVTAAARAVALTNHDNESTARVFAGWREARSQLALIKGEQSWARPR